MYLNRSHTAFSVMLVALVATYAVTSTEPNEPREVITASADTVMVNPYAVAPVHAATHEIKTVKRASFYAVKKVDPEFHYDLDSPTALELDGELSTSYPAELIYAWPEDTSETNSSSSPIDESSSTTHDSSDAMVRPEYRGKFPTTSPLSRQTSCARTS